MNRSVLVLFSVGFLIGCQEDLIPKKKLSNQEQAKLAAEDNAQMMIAMQEALDITAGALETKGVVEGRTKHGDHDTFGCTPPIQLNITIDRNHLDSIIYKGSVSVNYGDGSTCDMNNKRTGKITDEFTIIVNTKAKLRFNSTETITFEAFTRDSSTYNGIVIVSSAWGTETKVEGSNMSVTYEDGSTSSWKGMLKFGYEDVFKKQGQLHVSGDISGNTRQGIGYTARIMEEVIFKTGCFGWVKKVPVDGVVDITTNGIRTTTDFGGGVCDRIYTVAVNGEITTHTFE